MFGRTLPEWWTALPKLTNSNLSPHAVERRQTGRNLRKMFLFAIANDVRVVVIKLADRLHNMRHTRLLFKGKACSQSTEPWMFTPPLRIRFGMGAIKSRTWRIYRSASDARRMPPPSVLIRSREERMGLLKKPCTSLKVHQGCRN